jgi:hypothetical protein
MSKAYFVFEGDPPDKSAFEGGFYEQEVAERFAAQEATRRPGTTFTVMHRVTVFNRVDEKPH